MAKRWKTREVLVGKVGVGGNNPIRIQSMTTSNTRDVDATIDQIIRLADAGCEIARVTVQGMKEADACEGIKNSLIQRGYTIPLVADIHFYPPAAMRVVDFVDKVRINPGNFVDKRASFKTIQYDDASYALEIEKIEEKFTPLIEKCRRLKRAMRIGTNHGSLSDRIMNRYGDTPRGMLESALEFARVCRQNDYHDFMFSMKSSNPKVMIEAYRLLVEEMTVLGWDYPLHLGVTEAGAGEDGRIKSAMGIGSLLLDGIGDTIRVSLTEDAWNEIDPCQRLINLAKTYEQIETSIKVPSVEKPDPGPLHRDGAVVLSSCPPLDLYKKIKISGGDGLILSGKPSCQDELPLRTFPEALAAPKEPQAILIRDESPEKWPLLRELNPSLLLLAPSTDRLNYCRRFFDTVQHQVPVILAFHYDCSKEDLIIQAASEFGALFCDGLGDGLWINAPYENDFLRNLSLNILQAARMRTTKTDFISCPSCGRTLFDLQDVSKRIREKTSHLPGVKIAIMGCIVNGPGEMADADFGYVGSKPGMIDLYVGKTCVEKDIHFADADEKLIELIKKQGRWLENV
ncbi:MAG: (E)-4-hydroxy-3-methylbut-2-enyl-diphosphate synthase [Verrucomicrobia bacterium]|nr:(E)-4-hydroxy-3-methylbut-2-enyl-diphosphate synthase [Verrucomicrobiota bacterium]